MGVLVTLVSSRLKSSLSSGAAALELTETCPPRSRSSPNRLFSRIGLPSYLNLSRRLLRWMKQIHLPRTHLRMRYVRLVHAYHVLDGSCSHISLIDAMATLLVGWVAVDEGDNLSSYCVRLREECEALQAAIVQISQCE